MSCQTFRTAWITIHKRLKSFKLMSCPFEWMQIFQTGGNFNRMDTRMARMAAQVVRTDTQVVQTAGKQQANGIPFENGNLLVYVFPWKVTFTYAHKRALLL